MSPTASIAKVLISSSRYRELVFGGVEECVVCGEEEYHCDAPVTKYCQHLRNICPSCLKQMIKIAVKKGGWADIRCPDTSCRKQLEYNDVKQAATKEDFEQCVPPTVKKDRCTDKTRYDDFLIRQAAKGMPNFTPCNRPGGVCKMGQIHEAGGMPPILVMRRITIFLTSNRLQPTNEMLLLRLRKLLQLLRSMA